MTATAAEPSVALVLVVNIQKLREKNFSIEMPHLVIALLGDMPIKFIGKNFVHLYTGIKH